MRRSLVLTAVVLAFAAVAPASAQMCGPGQTTGSRIAQSATGQTGGMGCPMMRPSASADPFAAPQQRSGMCPMMAMMGRGGMGGMMGGGMGGMQQQPQQPSQPPTPGTGEAPQTPRPQ
jgi:hypothetical protein